MIKNVLFKETRGYPMALNGTEEHYLVVTRLAERYKISKCEITAILIDLALEQWGEHAVDAYTMSTYGYEES